MRLWTKMEKTTMSAARRPARQMPLKTPLMVGNRGPVEEGEAKMASLEQGLRLGTILPRCSTRQNIVSQASYRQTRVRVEREWGCWRMTLAGAGGERGKRALRRAGGSRRSGRKKRQQRWRRRRSGCSSCVRRSVSGSTARSVSGQRGSGGRARRGACLQEAEAAASAAAGGRCDPLFRLQRPGSSSSSIRARLPNAIRRESCRWRRAWM